MQKLIAITSYPDFGETHSKNTVGVASYTKTLLEGLVMFDPSRKVKIFADDVYKKKSYKENGIEVKRVWKRNHLGSLFNLFLKTAKENSKDVLVSFEIGLFGNLLSAFFGVLGILFLKLFGKRTHILLHQVATDFKGLEKNKFKASVLNLFSKLFYSLLKISSTQIYVFEQNLRQKLGGEKVKVLPHLILPTKKVEKKAARKRLGLSGSKTYGLYFGYFAPYKGVDWLVKSWPKSSELIVAGGINPNYKNDKKIVDFVKKVETLGNKKNITLTGFVAERDIKYYFSACDFVVLPYKMFFSSSGPLSLAFAHKKPVLLSKTLKNYAVSEDFKNALKISGLGVNDIVFEFNDKSLVKSINKLKKNKKKFEVFAEEIGKARSIKNISLKLSEYLGQSVKSL